MMSDQYSLHSAHPSMIAKTEGTTSHVYAECSIWASCLTQKSSGQCYTGEFRPRSPRGVDMALTPFVRDRVHLHVIAVPRREKPPTEDEKINKVGVIKLACVPMVRNATQFFYVHRALAPKGGRSSCIVALCCAFKYVLEGLVLVQYRSCLCNSRLFRSS